MIRSKNVFRHGQIRYVVAAFLLKYLTTHEQKVNNVLALRYIIWTRHCLQASIEFYLSLESDGLRWGYCVCYAHTAHIIKIRCV